MSVTPDNRIRFPAAKVDFANDVGLTSQDHDAYPSGGQQPRYDWLRLYLIGLLSMQSSRSEPTQYREGTPWFDLTDGTVKIRYDGEWRSLAEVIKLDTIDGTLITLASFYSTVSSLIGFKPTATFSGHSTVNGATTIPIPESLRAAGGTNSRPLVFVNGLLRDPRTCSYVGAPASPSSIHLSSGSINNGDEFTVLMLGMAASNFLADSVVLS